MTTATITELTDINLRPRIERLLHLIDGVSDLIDQVGPDDASVILADHLETSLTMVCENAISTVVALSLLHAGEAEYAPQPRSQYRESVRHLLWATRWNRFGGHGQCEGLTKRGTRCKIDHKLGVPYCHNHMSSEDKSTVLRNEKQWLNLVCQALRQTFQDLGITHGYFDKFISSYSHLLDSPEE